MMLYSEMWWIAAVAVFLLGGAVMLIWVTVTNSKGYHDKHHSHHSELMCNHCKYRTHHMGYRMSEVMRRWPMRIMGSKPPRGEGYPASEHTKGDF